MLTEGDEIDDVEASFELGVLQVSHVDRLGPTERRPRGRPTPTHSLHPHLHVHTHHPSHLYTGLIVDSVASEKG